MGIQVLNDKKSWAAAAAEEIGCRRPLNNSQYIQGDKK